MRNLKLVDAVIVLHDVAHLVAEELPHDELANNIRQCADRLHELSIQEGKNSVIANDIINKAKE
jgi:hypothetical protein